MEEKANNKKKKLLTVVLVFAVALAVTATTWCIYATYESPRSASPPTSPRIPDAPNPISCSEQTTHYSSGCMLLLHYDTNNDGIISQNEYDQAYLDYDAGVLTLKEAEFVWWATKFEGSINALCPGCYTGP